MRKLLSLSEWLLLIVVGGIASFVPKAYPDYSSLAWGFCIIVIAWMTYLAAKKPLQYESLKIVGSVIEYTEHGGPKRTIDLTKVVRVELKVQERIEMHGLEFIWVVRLEGSEREVEMEDEWQDRRRLIQAFKRTLPNFNSAPAEVKSWKRKQGIWVCYQVERSLSSISNDEHFNP